MSSASEAKCPLCNENLGKGCDSHIVPQWANSDASQGSKKTLLVPMDGSPPRRSPKGIYERGLICSACEGKTSAWENYAMEVFKKNTSLWQETIGLPINGWQYHGHDYKKLKLFFIQLILKAHYSTRPECEKINLGPRAEIALEYFRNPDRPIPSDEFSVLTFRYSESTIHHQAERSLILPYEHKFEFYRLISFAVVGFRFFIKISSERLPQKFRQWQLSEGIPLVAEALEFDGPAGMGIFREAVLAAKNRRRI